MNHITYWPKGDMFFFQWSGKHPSTVHNAPLICAPENADNYWPQVKGFLRWFTRTQSWGMSASLQNVKKLMAQFPGEIKFDGASLARIQILRHSAEQVREGAELLKGLRDKTKEVYVEYEKLPPLAEYQDTAVKYLTQCPAVPMFADPGVGKTFMVLTSTENQIKAGTLSRGKTIVFGKLSTLKAGWLADTEKFTNLKTEILWLPQTSKRREKILDKLYSSDADVFVMNHEGIHSFADDLAAVRFEKVVVDESTILKGFQGVSERISGGVFGKKLMQVAAHAKWRVILSGTPAPNGVHELWGQFKFLYPDGAVLEPSYYDFRQQYMDEKHFGDPDNPATKSEWKPKPTASADVANLIRDLVYRVRIRDHLKDLPERTCIVRSVCMGKEQAKAYAGMEDALSVHINNENITVNNDLTSIIKLRQITGGFIMDYEGKQHPFAENPKLDMLDALVREEIRPDEKIVIFAEFRWEIKMIAERYKDLGTVTIYGANKGSEKVENLDEFLTNPKVRIVIAHPQSAGHGVTLVNARYMIFYSMSYSSELNNQSIARIERAGQRLPMFIYYLQCDETIDEVMYEVVAAKSLTESDLIDGAGVAAHEAQEVWKRLRDKMRRKKFARKRRKSTEDGEVEHEFIETRKSEGIPREVPWEI